MLLCVCILFAVIGFNMLQQGQGIKGGLVFGVFGFGSMVLAVKMLPNSTYLRLTPVGFELCSLFKKTFFRWEEVTNFAVVEVPSGFTRTKLVGFNFTPLYRGGKVSSRIREINTQLSGREASLPDSFGLTHDELVAVLVQWHSAAMGYNRPH